MPLVAIALFFLLAFSDAVLAAKLGDKGQGWAVKKDSDGNLYVC